MNQANKTPRSGRRYLRFSLRAFLLVVALFGAGFGWLAMRFQHARRERAAIAAIGPCGIYYDYQRRGFDYSSDSGIETLRQFGTGAAYNFFDNYVYDRSSPPPGPGWLRKWLGDDILANVTYIRIDGVRPAASAGRFSKLRIANLAALEQLGGLEELDLECDVEPENLQHLLNLKSLRVFMATALSEPSDSHLAELAPLKNLEWLAISGFDFTNEGLKHIGTMHGLKHLTLAGGEFDDEGMPFLRELTELESLSLDNDAIGDDGIACLDGMTRLKLLDLSRTAVRQSGFEKLQRLHSLRHLDLGGCQIDDLALVNVGRFVNLVELDLQGTKITDAGLAHLTGLKKLRKLDLKETQISDAGLRNLSVLNELRNLQLDWTNVTDAGLECLHNMSSLETLGLANTKVTDTGLRHLHGFSKLWLLGVHHTAVTAEGEAAIKIAIPNLHVSGLVNRSSLTAPEIPKVDWSQPDDEDDDQGD